MEIVDPHVYVLSCVDMLRIYVVSSTMLYFEDDSSNDGSSDDEI